MLDPDTYGYVYTRTYICTYELCVLYCTCTSPSLLTDIKGRLSTAILRLRMLGCCDWDTRTCDMDFLY